MGETRIRANAVAAVLFASLFAAQAVLIAATPTLAELARDLDVSTAAAGQLRTVVGLTAAVVAVAAGGLLRRFDLRTLLLAGLALLAVGSLTSGLAPGFTILALAQVPIGVGIALVLSAGTTAAAEWAPADQRSRVLSWAITGQPAAWILGLPLIGLVGETSWRLGWLTVPLAAAVVALLAVSRARPSTLAAVPGEGLIRALREPAARRWAAGELLANAAWSGTLVFTGALLTESYGLSVSAASGVLAVTAMVYVLGTFTFRRFADRDSRPILVRLALTLAVFVPLLGTVRPTLAVSVLFLTVSAFAAGGRTLLGNSYGLAAAPGRRAALMAVRAATAQLGYLLGAAAAGTALALGGYPGFGIVLGGLFVAAAAALSWPQTSPALAASEAT